MGGLLLVVPAGLEPQAPATRGFLSIPDAMEVRNVPPIPKETVTNLRPYENIRSAAFQSWHPTAQRLLITTRFGETDQLHEVASPLGARAQVTFVDGRVLGGSYRPGRPDHLLFTLDEEGGENFQLYLLDRPGGRAHRVSDGRHRHLSPRWSRDGSLLAYTSNARNGRDFDLYVAAPPDGPGPRRVAELAGAWAVLDWSPDNRRLLLGERISIHESYLHAVDVETGERQTLTPRGDGPPVAYLDGRWSPDGASIYTLTDRESEFLRLARLDLATGLWTVLSGEIPWDVEAFDLSSDGALLAFFTNEEGFSRLHLMDALTGDELPRPEIPPGVASDLAFRPGTHEVAFTLSWARAPGDVYSYDPRSGRLERWTESETGGLHPETFALPQLFRYPTFDEVSQGERRTIPAFIYYPPPDLHSPPYPVLIRIHGGPESQFRPRFLARDNHLLNELGIAVIAPNVRGSAGYGRSYLQLDNDRRREDSVRDIGALLDWIATQPELLDPSRVMVAGGSYGGYMTLAAMVLYGDRLRCGHETVGISNFVTFLENTEAYRRDLRRVEYGDERDPEMRQFMEEISPVNRADRITKPLLVAQGANDPRVPRSESEQIVTALEGRGIPVWYVLAGNEGHGFRRKSNQDFLRAVQVEFIRRFLLGPAPGP